MVLLRDRQALAEEHDVPFRLQVLEALSSVARAGEVSGIGTFAGSDSLIPKSSSTWPISLGQLSNDKCGSGIRFPAGITVSASGCRLV